MARTPRLREVEIRAGDANMDRADSTAYVKRRATLERNARRRYREMKARGADLSRANPYGKHSVPPSLIKLDGLIDQRPWEARLSEMRARWSSTTRPGPVRHTDASGKTRVVG